MSPEPNFMKANSAPPWWYYYLSSLAPVPSAPPCEQKPHYYQPTRACGRCCCADGQTSAGQTMMHDDPHAGCGGGAATHAKTSQIHLSPMQIKNRKTKS
jgi:hypothetical protein